MASRPPRLTVRKKEKRKEIYSKNINIELCLQGHIAWLKCTKKIIKSLRKISILNCCLKVTQLDWKVTKKRKGKKILNKNDINIKLLWRSVKLNNYYHQFLPHAMVILFILTFLSSCGSIVTSNLWIIGEATAQGQTTDYPQGTGNFLTCLKPNSNLVAVRAWLIKMEFLHDSIKTIEFQ